MKSFNKAATAVIFGCLLSGAALAETDSSKAAEPDNSAVNKGVVQNEPTADDQSNAKTDVELAAKVRKAKVADKSLSTNSPKKKVLVK
jgi:hypothetical protein